MSKNDDIENRRFDIEAGRGLERRTGQLKTDKFRYANTTEGRVPVWERISRVAPPRHVFLMLTGGILLLIFVFTFVVGTSLLSDKTEIASKSEAGDEALKNDDALRKRLFDVVSRFRTAGTIEEKMKYVRRKQTVKPLLTAYYRNHPTELGEDDIVELRVASRLYRIDEISNANIYITAGITEGGKSHPYVIEEKQGHLAVDWETAVAYNPMTRDE